MGDGFGRGEVRTARPLTVQERPTRRWRAGTNRDSVLESLQGNRERERAVVPTVVFLCFSAQGDPSRGGVAAGDTVRTSPRGGRAAT